MAKDLVSTVLDLIGTFLLDEQMEQVFLGRCAYRHHHSLATVIRLRAPNYFYYCKATLVTVHMEVLTNISYLITIFGCLLSRDTDAFPQAAIVELWLLDVLSVNIIKFSL